MKIRKILVGRVFNWDNYENLRLGFEIEVEDGDLENELVLKAFNRLWRMNEVLAEYRDLVNAFDRLYIDLHGDGRRRGFFDETKEFIEKERDKAIKTLTCIEKSQLLPDVCEELEDVPLSRIKEKKEKLEKRIQELNEKMELLKALRDRFEDFYHEYNAELGRIKENFIHSEFEEALGRIKKLRNKISEIREEMDKVRPKQFYY